MAGKRVVELFGTKFIIVRGPPWTYKKPKFPILKRYNLPKPFDNTPLGDQQVKFAQKAISLYGKVEGKVNYKGVLMPAFAYELGQLIKGKTGGLTPEQRRAKKHEASTARLDQAMKERIHKKARQPTTPEEGLRYLYREYE